MPRTLLALVLLAALGVASWWWLSLDPAGASSPGAASPKAAAGSTQTPRDAQRPQEVATAPREEQRERSALAPPPPPPEPQGIEDGAGAAPVQGDFSSKYKDFEPRQLREQLQRLEGELARELDNAILPRFADGRFNEHAVSRDERRSLMAVLAEHTKGDPLCRAWPVFDPADASNPTAQQTLIAVRVVCLERGEHASLAALVDECAWLRAQSSAK